MEGSTPAPWNGCGCGTSKLGCRVLRMTIKRASFSVGAHAKFSGAATAPDRCWKAIPASYAAAARVLSLPVEIPVGAVVLRAAAAMTVAGTRHAAAAAVHSAAKTAASAIPRRRRHQAVQWTQPSRSAGREGWRVSARHRSCRLGNTLASGCSFCVSGVLVRLILISARCIP